MYSSGGRAEVHVITRLVVRNYSQNFFSLGSFEIVDPQPQPQPQPSFFWIGLFQNLGLARLDLVVFADSEKLKVFKNRPDRQA